MPQSSLAVTQHGVVEGISAGSIGRAGEQAVELRAVIGNQQQIDAGVERLHDGGADVVRIDRPITRSSVTTTPW